MGAKRPLKNKNMKKEYISPEILVVELKQQGCLMAGSVTGTSNTEDIDWVSEGLSDDDYDV